MATSQTIMHLKYAMVRLRHRDVRRRARVGVRVLDRDPQGPERANVGLAGSPAEGPRLEVDLGGLPNARSCQYSTTCPTLFGDAPELFIPLSLFDGLGDGLDGIGHGQMSEAHT